MNNDLLNQKIEFIKGVGPQKAKLLNSEVGIYNLNDMLNYYPFRYEDRSKINNLSEVSDNSVEGVYRVKVLDKKISGRFKSKSLKVKVKDGTGYGELVWMKGLEWIEDKIIIGRVYLVFGKPKILSLIHI